MIFSAQIKLDCEDHFPYYGISPNETLLSFTKIENSTEVYHTKGKDRKNKSYARTLEVKFVENQVNLHEIIRYEHSEIDFLENNYIIKFNKLP